MFLCLGLKCTFFVQKNLKLRVFECERKKKSKAKSICHYFFFLFQNNSRGPKLLYKPTVYNTGASRVVAKSISIANSSRHLGIDCTTFLRILCHTSGTD